MEVDAEHAAQFTDLTDSWMLDRIRSQKRKAIYMFIAVMEGQNLQSHEFYINGIKIEVRDNVERWHGRYDLRR